MRADTDSIVPVRSDADRRSVESEKFVDIEVRYIMPGCTRVRS